MTSPTDQAARLAGAGFLLAAVWVAVSIGFSWQLVPALRIGLQVLGGVGAPMLTVAALLVLLGRRTSVLVVTTSAVAFVSFLFFSLSFSIGLDERDAGGELGLFGNSTWLFGLLTLLGLAALTAQLVLPGIRAAVQRPRVALAVAIGLGAFSAPFAAIALLAPITVALAALAVTVVALARSSRPRAARTPAAPVADPPLLLLRVRILAASSLASTLVVWIGSIGASIAATGTPGATAALGSAMAVGQLAAVPLLLAGTLVVGARVGGDIRTLWIGFGVGAGGLAVVSSLMTLDAGAGSIDLIVALSVFVGAWASACVWVLTARVWLALVTLVGVAVLYAALVGMTGGIALALVSGFLAVGGAGVVARRARTTSPGMLPASP